MKVIGGSASRKLSEKLATILQCDLVHTETFIFPDGEKYVRVPTKLQDEEVVVVQTTYPNDNLIEMILILDAVKRAGAKNIIGVVPYFSYSRQDKQFKEGEAVSAEAIARILSERMDYFITVDIHNPQTLKCMSIISENVYATKPMAEALKGYDIDVVISPDKGSVERSRLVAKELGASWDFMEKTRIDGSTVEIKPKNVDVQGKNVVIVDDIISTGGTIVECAKRLKADGASSIIACCVHGLFISNSLEKIRACVTDVFCSDTIERIESKYSVAEPIAAVIKRWL